MLSTNHPNNVAVVDENGVSRTYDQLHEAIEQFASVVSDERQLGFVLTSNTLGSLTSYLACIEGRKVVPLMLDAEMDATALAELIDRYQPRYLMCAKDHPAAEGRGEVVYTYEDYQLVDTGAPACPLNPELGLLLTTSGSTGTSKLVRLTYDNLHANAESIATYLRIDEHERPVTTLPMNYTYGISVINSHLLRGACLLLTNGTVMQKPFWEFFRAQNGTSIAGVPYTYQMLRRLRFERMDLPTLKTMTQAGGKLSRELHQFFAEYAQRTDREFIVMYGQTEATARMSYLPWENSLEKIGSIGVAIPGGAFRLIDVDGSDITEPEVEGELVYEGPNVSLGYATSREGLAAGDDNHGVLVTGDMAKVDADGYYYITGRKKRFLKMFGKRTSLDECEQIIASHFDIECACAGQDDLLQVFVTDASKAPEVREYVTKKLGINRTGIKVIAIEAIPRSDSGKIQYKELPAC